jgi:predicted DNA binding CopG/RHH family protein
MNKKTKMIYTDEDLGELKVVKDFLPSPALLAKREKTIKVTLSLTEATLNFFKNSAKIHHMPYQKMIRCLLDEYKEQHHIQPI